MARSSFALSDTVGLVLFFGMEIGRVLLMLGLFGGFSSACGGGGGRVTYFYWLGRAKLKSGTFSEGGCFTVGVGFDVNWN